MRKAGKILAILLRRWTSKTPKQSKITQIIMGVVGSAALITLSIPSLGLPVWAGIGIGIVAATSSAYEQLKDNSNETVVEETKKILKTRDK